MEDEEFERRIEARMLAIPPSRTSLRSRRSFNVDSKDDIRSVCAARYGPIVTNGHVFSCSVKSVRRSICGHPYCDAEHGCIASMQVSICVSRSTRYMGSLQSGQVVSRLGQVKDAWS